MGRSEKLHKRLYNFFSSKELLLIILLCLCLSLGVTTFVEFAGPLLWGAIRFFVLLMLVNLSLCTYQKINYLPKAVLLIHLGVMVTFAGGFVSSYGFVATVNIYEGSMVDRVFRPDIEEDVSLGFNIMVKDLHEEYYPVQVRVGVLDGEEKAGLFELKTGESFSIGGYDIRVDSLETYPEKLNLSVFGDDGFVGTADTLGRSDLPYNFPYDFKFVAFLDPVIKRSWVELVLTDGTEIVAEGRTEVNAPFRWEGFNFYHTAVNRDDNGIRYVGIQISKDPGVLYVYTGFFLILLGGLLYLAKKIRGLR